MEYGISKSIIIPILIIATLSVSQASDLVSDGTFDSGIEGWHLVGRGSLGHAADEGAGAPGSLQLTGGLAGDCTQAVAGYCLASLPPDLVLEFGAETRIAAGSAAQCRVAIFESERSDCRWISLGAHRKRTFFFSGWNEIPSKRFVTGSSTRSVEVRLHCSTAPGDTGPLEVLFDDFSITTPSGLIFADDLEAGSTDRWSRTLP